MEKTIDQIKNEVLSELERICPLPMQVVTLPNGTQVRRDDISYPDFEFGYTYYGKFCPQFSVHDSTDWGVKCAYHILGLESRAKDAEIARLQSEMSILQGERRMAESLSLPETIDDLEPYLLALLSSHTIRVSEGARAIRNAFDGLMYAKDAEIERLKSVVAVWNPVSAMAAITESLKLANQEAEIARLRGMLEAVVSHAKEPAMRDWQFRQFAIENCEYTLKGGEDD